MIRVQNDFSLRRFNTLRLDVKAKHFCRISEVADLVWLLSQPKYRSLPFLLLGEGSNLLFVRDFAGTVAKMEISGIEEISKNKDRLLLAVGAGENWHKLVSFTVSRGWGGIENLALIPGTVGAAPVQNLAAYGQCLADVFVSLEALDLKTLKMKTFTKSDCRFGYRQSVFKNKLRGRYAITRVIIALSKTGKLETSYYSQGLRHDSIQAELTKFAKPPYRPKDVFSAVIRLRRQKLPDVDKIPSAGSFFLNPVVSSGKLAHLQTKVKELQYYPIDQLTYLQPSRRPFRRQSVKIAAGRLLDELGWRGKQLGNVSVYPKHALVITHNGQATGKEILRFAGKIQQDCYRRFGVKLELEVNVID